MQQATPLTIYARSRSDPDQRQWVVVIIISLILHLAILLWVSLNRPDFPNVTFSEFEVGLQTTEGIGQLLQASPDAETAPMVGASETDLVLPEELEKDASTDLLAEMSLSTREEHRPFAQIPVENIESATAITPSATSTGASEVAVTESVDIEGEITEARTDNSEITEVESVNDFFQPATIVSDDPVAPPIEELAEVIAPQEEVLQINPELANDSVEVLEIKAVDVLPKRPTKSTQTQANPDSQNTLASTNNNASSLGASGAEVVKQSLVIPRSYVIKLKDWLSKYKQYPPEAYRLRQEGVAIIGLKINKMGQVLSYTIKRTSGYPLLDEAVEKMIDTATNMPALPVDFPRDSVELLVPVRFKVD